MNSQFRDNAERLLTAAQRIIDRADVEKRSLLPEERTVIASLQETARAQLKEHETWHRPVRRLAEPMPIDGSMRYAKPVGETWRDMATGQELRVLRRDENLAGLAPEGRFGCTVGDLLAAWLAPTRRDTHPDARRALGETLNASGGILVPDQLSSEVLDLARAQSVLLKAGARTVAMTSDNCVIARVKTDPTFSFAPENAPVPESDVTFDAIQLTAKKIGCIVRVSRELVEDAANLPSLLEQVLASSLAAEIDRQCLLGTGSEELEGLWLQAGLNESSIGVVTDYAEMNSALVKVLNANQTPNALILNPAMSVHLENLKAAVDGQYLTPPPGIAALQRLATTSLPTTGYSGSNEMPGFLLDGTKVLLGVRRQIEVAMSDQRYFDYDQIGFKVTARVDVTLERDDAACYLSGMKVS